MDNMCYEILSGDIVVAVWEDSRLTVKCEKLLPQFLKKTPNVNAWLATRAIDAHRANSRLLKKALRLSEWDDCDVAMYVNGATITDNYWVRESGSLLTYKDINFSNDYFALLALRGDYDSFVRASDAKTSRTPELTNTGSFEKCWRLEDERWWLYKNCNRNELFSELFVYNLGMHLGFAMARYERVGNIIRSCDFTNAASVNFEPASAFMGDNEDYFAVLKALGEICPSAIPNFIQMIFLDTICANPDRHTNNFGLLRDTLTGEFLGLAPNYDNNLALISRGYPAIRKSEDLLVRLFNELVDACPKYKQYIPTLDAQCIEDILDNIGMRVRRRHIVDFVMTRYNLIHK